jgi:hypothetical protein
MQDFGRSIRTFPRCSCMPWGAEHSSARGLDSSRSAATQSDGSSGSHVLTFCSRTTRHRASPEAIRRLSRRSPRVLELTRWHMTTPESTARDELENRRGRQAPGGSNPSPSAKPLSFCIVAHVCAPLGQSWFRRFALDGVTDGGSDQASKRTVSRGRALLCRNVVTAGIRLTGLLEHGGDGALLIRTIH